MTHIDATPPPAIDDPDYPPGCVAAPAGYRRLPYLAWHAMAERRAKREGQRWCLTCERYRWASTPCGEPSRAAPPRRRETP